MPATDGPPWHKTCLRCGGAMEEGYLNGYSSAASPSRWISGLYVLSTWTGYPKDWKARAKHKVLAYRCEACGFLDLYAPDEA